LALSSIDRTSPTRIYRRSSRVAGDPEAGACDGFNITPATPPGGGEDFVDMVVPELRRRGLFRTEYEGGTLRENLGLRPVINRYSRDHRAAE
jgi:hypothetical protein